MGSPSPITTEEEWLLIIGNVGIPEWAAQIPSQFLRLIRNLRENEQRKTVVSTGNLGSDGADLAMFLQSLVHSPKLDGDPSHQVHLARGILPSSANADGSSSVPEKELLHFDMAGIKIGVAGAGHLSQAPWDDEDGESGCFPDAQSLFGPSVVVDILITGGSKASVRRKEGLTSLEAGPHPYVWLCPGSLTGCSPFPQRASRIERLVKSSCVTLHDVAEDPPAERLATVAKDLPVGSETASGTDGEETAQVPETTVLNLDGLMTRPSFMLLHASKASLLLFIYSLDCQGQIEVQRVDLGHPRPVFPSAPEGVVPS